MTTEQTARCDAVAETQQLQAEIARLTAELAEARKPRWVGSDLTVPARKTIAVVSLQADGTGWRYFGGGGMSARGYNTEAEAKAAAEKACGVEVDHG